MRLPTTPQQFYNIWTFYIGLSVQLLKSFFKNFVTAILMCNRGCRVTICFSETFMAFVPLNKSEKKMSIGFSCFVSHHVNRYSFLSFYFNNLKAKENFKANIRFF